MAQLYYYYGAMQSSKSASLLMVAHNYESQGKKVLLFTPDVDDRSGVGVIASRVGIDKKAHALSKDEDVFEIVKEKVSEGNSDKVHCVLVDESQFLTREHVVQLTLVVDKLNIPVMCYGLKNDFKNNLFEGSEALLIYADKIIEIKTICGKESCGKKATANLRLSDGKPIYEGNQIQIGDEVYLPVCREHYYNYL